MRTKGIHGVQLDIEVPFFDVDMMQVVWHGHYVKYLEQARRALFADLGCDYLAMQASGYAWPVVDLQLRYIRPAVFSQYLTVRAELKEWETRLKIHYLITDRASGERVTRQFRTGCRGHFHPGDADVHARAHSNGHRRPARRTRNAAMIATVIRAALLYSALLLPPRSRPST